MADRPPGSAQGYIDPNWPPPGEYGDATIIIYGYTPNFALCILALVLFFVLGLAHGWQLFKYRTWYFSTTMVGVTFVRSFSSEAPFPTLKEQADRYLHSACVAY
jgi:hypothetical protein